MSAFPTNILFLPNIIFNLLQHFRSAGLVYVAAWRGLWWASGSEMHYTLMWVYNAADAAQPRHCTANNPIYGVRRAKTKNRTQPTRSISDQWKNDKWTALLQQR